MANRFETLAAQADELRQEHAVPGLALGMSIEGEDHIATFGVSSVENPLEVTVDTLFQIGSTTKTVTATALMCLDEEGELSLDDRVRDHIPELRQERLGHASIKTTLDTYGHLFDVLDEAAADRLDGVWRASRADQVMSRANVGTVVRSRICDPARAQDSNDLGPKC